MPDCQAVARQFMEEHQLTSETAYGFAGADDPKAYFFEGSDYGRLLENFVSKFTPREHFEIWYSCPVELSDAGCFYFRFFTESLGYDKDETLHGFALGAVYSTINAQIPSPTR